MCADKTDPHVSELIPIVKAARLFGRHPSALRQAIERGRLRAWKVGGDWLTTRWAVAEYLGQDEVQAA